MRPVIQSISYSKPADATCVRVSATIDKATVAWTLPIGVGNQIMALIAASCPVTEREL